MEMRAKLYRVMVSVYCGVEGKAIQGHGVSILELMAKLQARVHISHCHAPFYSFSVLFNHKQTRPPAVN